MDSAELISAKKKYGALGYVCLHEEFHFYYRFLTILELDLIRGGTHLDQDELEEAICSWVLIDPSEPIDWDDPTYPVNLSSELAEVIVNQSGYISGEELIEEVDEKREEASNNIVAFMIVEVCKVFNYTPMQLRKLSMPDLLDQVVLAELTTNNNILQSNNEQPAARSNMPPIVEGQPPIPGHEPGIVSMPQGKKFNMNPGDLRDMSEAISHDSLANAMAMGSGGDPIPKTGYNIHEEEEDYYEQLGDVVDRGRDRVRELEGSPDGDTS
jgi:hypothetical protein